MTGERPWRGGAGSFAGLAGLVLWLASFNPVTPLFGAEPGAAATPPTHEAQIAAVKAEKNNAIFQVQHIVNQPVARMNRTPDMVVVTYPGWFHPDAVTPDFNTADVRTTQEFPYEGSQYVTSDLNHGVVFLGRELAFNRLTKYFITDRSVPKKKLTEAELLEINRLYRIIGHCDQQLDELQKPRTIILGLDLTRLHDAVVNTLQSPTGTAILGRLAKYRYILVAFVFLLLITLYGVRQKRPAA